MDDASDANLDALIRRVDPDRWMSSRFIGDAGLRADVVGLYAFDHELARAPKIASNPLIGEIRLTWWREALDEIYAGRPVRRHPTAQALAAVIARHRLDRAPLEALIDARYRELDPEPMDEADAVTWARETAGQVAVLAASALDPGGDPEAARPAAAAWALARAGHPFAAERAEGRRLASSLSATAFPAVAHAALIGRAGGSAFARRVRLTWAVARGRI